MYIVFEGFMETPAETKNNFGEQANAATIRKRIK